MSQNNPNSIKSPKNKKNTDLSPSEINSDLPLATISNTSIGSSSSNRFKKKFKVINTCDLCNNQMFFGFKCKKCKYHKQGHLVHDDRVDVTNADTETINIDANVDKNTNKIENNSNTDDSDQSPSIRINSPALNPDGDLPDDYFNFNSDDENESTKNSREWDIPFDDIEIMNKIGEGRFGTVYRARWHGPVAVKTFNKNYSDNELFKLEIATFKKTRHENIILFLGVCHQPKAIITSLCKGHTLYTHIHISKIKFNLNESKMISQQISLGMGYLHSRRIIHKDLKTKNIFLENGKIIITDFGLLCVTKLEYRNGIGLNVTNDWLTYLSPEIIQNLKPYPVKIYEQLPFTDKSDIYAFGTIWFELLTGEFPFKTQPAEAIIFQIGRGMKQSLTNLCAPMEVKIILMYCWSYDYSLRPTFSKILQLLKKLPKKRLERSPSNPEQLSPSTEFMF